MLLLRFVPDFHRPRWLSLLVIVTLLTAILPAPGPAAAQQPAGPTVDTFRVETFSGPDFVDFWWQPADLPGCITFTIWRKPSAGGAYTAIATPACGAGFYTDSSAAAGTSYQYQLTVQNDSDPPTTLFTAYAGATPGQITGYLNRSLTLGGALDLVSVYTADGVTLSLNNVTASGGSVYDAYDRPLKGGGTQHQQGVVLVSGGRFDGTAFGLTGASSALTGLELTSGSISTRGNVADATLDASALAFAGTGAVSLSGSAFTESTISVAESASVDIGQNSFISSTLQIRGTATGDIYGNAFVGSALRIFESADVLAESNTFSGTIPSALAVIDVASNTGVTLELNTLQVDGNAGTKPAIRIQPESPPAEGAVYDLTSNVLRGDDGATAGVTVVADDAGSTLTLAMTGNIIGRFARAVHIHDNLYANKTVNATLSGNTVTANAYGLYPDFGGSDSSLIAHNNCIAGNTEAGVRCEHQDFVVDATNNYWGHPNGPKHLINPDGSGDRIWCSDAATEIDFDPWLASGACDISGLSVANVEVVQTLQTISGTIPLVAEKATVVRVYPDVAIGFVNVDGTLTGIRDGQVLGVLQARRPVPATTITDWDLARSDADASLVFDLPRDWLHGVIDLRAEVVESTAAAQAEDPSQVSPLYPAQAGTTAVMTSTAVFEERRPVAITYIPASVDTGVKDIKITPKEILQVHERIVARFPFGDVSVRILPDADRHPAGVGGLGAGTTWTYLSAVTRRWELLNNPDGVTDYYVTVYGTDDAGFTGSYFFFGEPNGCAACGLRFEGYDCVAGVANQLGMRPLAVDRETADPPFDYVFPYPDLRTHVFGYDVVADEVQSPELYDLMAPEAMDGVPNWISDYHYEKAYLNLAPQSPAVQRAAIDAEAAEAAGDYLYVTGLAGPDDGYFHPVIHLQNSPMPDDANPVDPAGAYCLQARNAYGQVLEETCFDLDLTNVDTGEEDAWTYFAAVLVDDPEIKQLLIRHDGSTVKALVVPGTPPQVTLASAGYESAYGMVWVAWTTPLDDHPNQRYHVHYSPDNGLSWIPVAIDIVPDAVVYTDGAFRWGVLAHQIPASDRAKLRLIASDGYNETTVTSAAFTVPDVGPWLDVTAPENNAIIESFPVLFEGYAFDVENGDRSAAMTWTSDRDGPLGAGDTISVTALSTGVHVVTLAADDGDGNVATETVRLTVKGATGAYRVYLPAVLR